MTAVVRALLSREKIRQKAGWALGGERKGSSRPGQAGAAAATAASMPHRLDLCRLLHVNSRLAEGGRVVCWVGGLCGRLAGRGPARLRDCGRPALSTLDSNIGGLRWRPPPFSTADSGPATAPHLPAAETPGQG